MDKAVAEALKRRLCAPARRQRWGITMAGDALSLQFGERIEVNEASLDHLGILALRRRRRSPPGVAGFYDISQCRSVPAEDGSLEALREKQVTGTEADQASLVVTSP